MTNKYLSYDAERGPKVRAMFSRLAWRYDLINDLMSLGMHRRWKRETRRSRAGGHGIPPRARPLLRQRRPLLPGRGPRRRQRRRSRLHAAHARRRPAARRRPPRAAAASSRRTPWRCPLPTASFDVLTISYGLRNIADIPRALGEMRRVLAPGGRAVVLDFGKPDNAAARALYRGLLRTMMPVDRLALSRRPGDLPLHPGVARALPGAARRREADAGGGVLERALRESAARDDGDQCGEVSSKQ